MPELVFRVGCSTGPVTRVGLIETISNPGLRSSMNFQAERSASVLLHNIPQSAKVRDTHTTPARNHRPPYLSMYQDSRLRSNSSSLQSSAVNTWSAFTSWYAMAAMELVTTTRLTEGDLAQDSRTLCVPSTAGISSYPKENTDIRYNTYLPLHSLQPVRERAQRTYLFVSICYTVKEERRSTMHDSIAACNRVIKALLFTQVCLEKGQSRLGIRQPDQVASLITSHNTAYDVVETLPVKTQHKRYLPCVSQGSTHCPALAEESLDNVGGNKASGACDGNNSTHHCCVVVTKVACSTM